MSREILNIGKFISIILIPVFLFNIFGYQILFYALQQKIQKEIKLQIKKELKNEERTLIVTSADNETEIQWIKPKKEFKYKGEMYDVVKIKNKGHKNYYYCICDIKEKQLIAHYQKTQKKNNTEEKIKRVKNVKLFFQQFNYPIELYCSDYIYPQNSYKILVNYIIIPSPPPKMA